MRTSAWKRAISSERSCSESSRRLLCGDGGFPAAQDVLLNLAGRRLRQLFHERDGVRCLEVRQPLPDEVDQLPFARRGAWLKHNERVRRLAPFLVLDADDA